MNEITYFEFLALCHDLQFSKYKGKNKLCSYRLLCFEVRKNKDFRQDFEKKKEFVINIYLFDKEMKCKLVTSPKLSHLTYV